MKKYQAVAFLLSTAMTVSSVAPVFGASNDIFGHWAEFTITKWQNEGRIGGYEDGTFKPDRAITRAEFVRLLNSAAPTAFTSSASINFSDVKESDWFYADVAKAVGGRVASGFEDGTFRPGETVTRMQAAVFICNAKGLTPNEAAANNFTDAAQIPAWAKGAVGAAVAAGYLSGYPDGSFGGSKGMTRAEAVSTLDRVLGGGSTNTPSGEIDTTDRDNTSTEDNRTAEAGNMVWTSGGGGGGSSKGSSSSSSSDKDKKTHNVTIRSQSDADDYEGKTLTGTTTIYPDNGLKLNDIRFKGDVDIKVQSDAVVASAYADSDVAVAAAYTAKINIFFEGKTSVSGIITVIENNVPGSQVVITTSTPRKLAATVVAKVATAIKNFTIDSAEATAPLEVAEGASVGTVELGKEASLEVAENADGVNKVNVTGDAKDIVLNGEGSTDIAVRNGASVENVAVNGSVEASVAVNGNATVDNVKVSDSASADVAVKDSATVGKVELSDTATAKVDVAADAKVDTITSTSTAKGSEVTGEGTVNKIEATDKSTIDTSDSGDNIPDVSDKPVEPTPDPTPDPEPPVEETAKITPETKEITASEQDQTVAFTATGFAADATIEWSATAGETGATIAANEDDSTKATLTIPANAPAGTITVTAKTGDVTATATVTVKAADETPGVDKTELTAAITAATEAKATAITTDADDGSDVAPNQYWVTKAVMADFEAAITAAQAVASDDTATQDDVDAAVSDLTAAQEIFESAKKLGTLAGLDALKAMVPTAKTLHDNTQLSTSGDGKDVAVGTKWATTAQKTDFKAVIDAAQTLIDNNSTDDTAINEAIENLTTAQETFETAVAAQDGKKVIAIGVTGLPEAADVKAGTAPTVTVTPGEPTQYTVTAKWQDDSGNPATDLTEGETVNLVLEFAPTDGYALDDTIATVGGVTGTVNKGTSETAGNLVFEVPYEVQPAAPTQAAVEKKGVTTAAGNDTITLTITGSGKFVTGVTADKFTLSSGTVSSVALSNNNTVATLTLAAAASAGTVDVTIAADAFTEDAVVTATNVTAEASTADDAGTQAAVEKKGVTTAAGNDTITLTIAGGGKFVTGVAASKFTLSSGTVSSVELSNNDTVATLTLAAAASAGTVDVTIAADAFTEDAVVTATNVTAEASTADDAGTQAAVEKKGVTTAAGNDTITLTIAGGGKFVTGVAASKFTLSSGTVSSVALSSNDTVATLTLAAGASAGTVDVTIAADAFTSDAVVTADNVTAEASTEEAPTEQQDVTASVDSTVSGDNTITIVLSKGTFDATQGAVATNYAINGKTISTAVLSNSNKTVTLTLDSGSELDGSAITVKILIAAFDSAEVVTAADVDSATASTVSE
ncbi:S-layer homology domain-containing protein [Clostridium sp. MD294]|uniref:S-layer homology domain-containing protein n=1 Tax=Clostridium sp. MD294 TaxID=97138 RepID=UPI0020745BB8|nr:S-layer homology domain-containing protein [Clostridium sp. MD294]USF28719.1 hypothetical protein C820_000093 [Clostridium sp. MD294]